MLSSSRHRRHRKSEDGMHTHPQPGKLGVCGGGYASIPISVMRVPVHRAAGSQRETRTEAQLPWTRRGDPVRREVV
eukprot:787822-Pyramimonas_sp.AAC.1